MKKLKRKPLSKKTVALAVAAIVLLTFSSFQGTRAALTYYSDEYKGEVSMRNIGITLLENGNAVDVRNGYNGEGSTQTWNTSGDQTLLKDMLDQTDGNLLIGKKYDEKLTVKNSAEINQFVFVSVYKRWVKPVKGADGKDQKDSDGNTVYEPDTFLDPALIELEFVTDNGWHIIKDKTTAERTVLYYDKSLASGEETPELLKSITINADVAGEAVTTETTIGNKTYYKTTYEYNGTKFILEAEAQALQTHNAEEAILSSWGLRANITDHGSYKSVDSMESVRPFYEGGIEYENEN